MIYTLPHLYRHMQFTCCSGFIDTIAVSFVLIKFAYLRIVTDTLLSAESTSICDSYLLQWSFLVALQDPHQI